MLTMARPKKIIEEVAAAAPAAEVDTAPVPTPKKKTARRKATMAVGDAKFDIFSQSSVAQQTRDLLAKAKMADGFKSAADIYRSYLPLPWLAFQYLIGRIGIPVNTIIEFIGQENTGKSSLVMSLLGHLVPYNIPCYYINTEPKMLESDWISRLVGADEEMGEKIKNVIEVSEQVYTLDEMDTLLKKWIDVKRKDQGIPTSTPLVIVVDTITKLLNPEEAEALIDEKTAGVALNKGVGDISKKPGVTANWMHKWCRSLKPLLEKENVTLICVSGQNVNMNAGSSAMAPDGGASLNKTRPGGTAMNQSAAIQITITRKGALKDSKSFQIGEIIRARVVKNSFGPKRDIEYHLHNDKFEDRPGYVDQAIDMREVFCNILVRENICGLKCERKRYSSASLGIDSATYQTLYSKIENDPELTAKVCSALNINGYEADVDDTETT